MLTSHVISGIKGEFAAFMQDSKQDPDLEPDPEPRKSDQDPDPNKIVDPQH
jgi:hypothetical protein